MQKNLTLTFPKLYQNTLNVNLSYFHIGVEKEIFLLEIVLTTCIEIDVRA